ncbi:hypothetical protein SAMN05428945_5318 [Streptomyces sp. 2224.1]|uniref:hypothetical protein n=1 Tax=unclassified Streptomyces TaxID=2593676 RepID=UPI00088B70D5|nr:MULTISPECIES: hypothetical protein [unclassified Streptomyces]PBC80223.1 hypothetical protein BX261_0032 [Streptomyces sp. 2321.6]SDR59721.1 hypothetical protein SAMN05216511_7195 [Streptomyces sp. KS_16]SEB66605.1 hypothetical protein SAMN05428940_0032 [Streptomyces sp. 2133.1]SED57201.1 hypothetical protein SAMN05428945_5318 [Streptomyces sp. 2224.1]SNC59364.1 hypothetical protein SAMN06272741_0035 [Streptomyces sp. 2114.4]
MRINKNATACTVAGVVAALAIGVAAPAAQAATNQAPARTAAVQTTGRTVVTPSSIAVLSTLSTQAQTTGKLTTADVHKLRAADVSTKGVGGLIAKAVKLLKKVPGAYRWGVAKAKSAYKMGKNKGVAYLKKKVSEMSNWSPTKWAWKTVMALGNGQFVWQLIKFLSGH